MNVRTPNADKEVRKQRLLREALVNSGGIPSAESVGRVFGAVGLALMAAVAFSGGLPESGEWMVKKAADANVASARPSLPITQSGGENGRTEPEGNVQDLTY